MFRTQNVLRCLAAFNLLSLAYSTAILLFLKLDRGNVFISFNIFYLQYFARAEDLEIVALLLLARSLISFVLKLLALIGLHSSRRWLLLPYMVFLCLLMFGILMLVILFRVTPFIYFSFLPLSLLLLMVLGSWLQAGQPRPLRPEEVPCDPEAGTCPVDCLLTDLPPRYEQVLRTEDRGLPSYQEATSLTSQEKPKANIEL